ncbi:MAG: hypothetical protein LBL74_05105 [Bacteroidales bacterium]|jgi:cell division protein FtsZ|nr:hypothetical protein [Bacteroidales bacterium]
MDNYLILDAEKQKSSYIKVIGVGGCGTNTANHLFSLDSTKIDFIACNTDKVALKGSPIANKIQLGISGLGAGTDPKIAEEAAEKQKDEIKEAIGNDVRMLFITAGMGKGTGTGASHVIAKIAREIEAEIGEDILIVAIVTSPMEDEGPQFVKRATEGIAKLREVADTTIVIDNNKLEGLEDMDLDDAFTKIDNILVTSVKCIYDMMTSEARVRADFNDVKKVLKNSGVALMGVGEANGENRAMDAILKATSSELLNNQLYHDAKSVLLSISYSSNAMAKVSERKIIMQYIRETMTNPNVELIQSSGRDESLGDNLKVAIVIAGFSNTTKVINEIPIQPEPERTIPIDIPENTNNQTTTPDTDIIIEEETEFTPDTTISQQETTIEFGTNARDAFDENPALQSPVKKETELVTNTLEPVIKDTEYFTDKPYAVKPYSQQETLEERIKNSAQRMRLINKYLSSQKGYEEYKNLSLDEVNQMLDKNHQIEGFDNSQRYSLQSNVSNMNDNGRIDINSHSSINAEID